MMFKHICYLVFFNVLEQGCQAQILSGPKFKTELKPRTKVE